MPKPIKKRVVKKAKVEEDAKTYLEHAKSFFSQEKKRIQIVSAVLLALIVIGVGLFLYFRNTTLKADAARSEAYGLYLSASATDDPLRLREALDRFKSAYALKKSPLILYYESDIYQRMGDTQNAIATLNALIQDYSSDRDILPLCYSKLGMLYEQQKDHEKALATFQRLAQSDLPVYRDLALYQEGVLYRKMGREEEAKKAFENLKAMFPHSPFAKDLGVQEKAGQGAGQSPSESKAK